MANTKADDQQIEEARGVHDELPQKNHTDYNLVDQEVAKYATDTAIEIDDATNKRLRRMIDKRILVVMMVTYLIQTLDKGAMSFSSIMGIRDDAHLASNQVNTGTLVSLFKHLLCVVFLVDDCRIHCYSLCRIPCNCARWN